MNIAIEEALDALAIAHNLRSTETSAPYWTDEQGNILERTSMGYCIRVINAPFSNNPLEQLQHGKKHIQRDGREKRS